jgi:hypothetical protein
MTPIHRALLLELLDRPAGASVGDLALAIGEPERATGAAAATLAGRARPR